jgi:hypothetical protein
VLLVIGIGQDLEQILVARRPTAVLGRAAADGFEQKEIRCALDCRRHLLELDGVRPAVAEVVKVGEGLAPGIGENSAEAALPGLQRGIVEAVGVRFAPAAATDAELVEVRVGPAHGGLDDEMQEVQADVGRHEAPHDDGLDVVERDLEDGDRGCGHGPQHRHQPDRGSRARKRIISAIECRTAWKGNETSNGSTMGAASRGASSGPDSPPRRRPASSLDCHTLAIDKRCTNGEFFILCL